MDYIFQSNDEPIVAYLTKTISKRLEGDESVLWLVPGGSAMNVAVTVLGQLEEMVDTSRLCITLTDERYGEPGHENENWSHLAKLGFNTSSVNAYRVLRGKDMQETAAAFDAMLSELCQTYEYKIGLFGVGEDGHTSGIKPHSPALHSEAFAVGYEGEDFARVTTTPELIAQLDEAVAYVMGVKKHAEIAKLIAGDVAVDDQPAQALRLAKKTILFGDMPNIDE